MPGAAYVDLTAFDAGPCLWDARAGPAYLEAFEQADMSSRRAPVPMSGLARYLPIIEWGREYRAQTLASDLLAAVIVTLMLIPQSLAYAILAGLPAQMGLYASITPLLAYGLFGTSRVLAVGPVAVVSLMTAATLGSVATPGSAEYVAAAMVLPMNP